MEVTFLEYGKKVQVTVLLILFVCLIHDSLLIGQCMTALLWIIMKTFLNASPSPSPSYNVTWRTPHPFLWTVTWALNALKEDLQVARDKFPPSLRELCWSPLSQYTPPTCIWSPLSQYTPPTCIWSPLSQYTPPTCIWNPLSQYTPTCIWNPLSQYTPPTCIWSPLSQYTPPTCIWSPLSQYTPPTCIWRPLSQYIHLLHVYGAR